jgi:LacI family transcriptional regulator
VPDELGVVGYDDTPMAAWPSLNLTSISQGTKALGKQAASTITKLISNPTVRIPPAVLPPRLVVRGSTSRAERVLV